MVSTLGSTSPDDIIVIDRHEGESQFRRLREDELSAWLAEEYTKADLWQKNVFGGGPVYE